MQRYTKTLITMASKQVASPSLVSSAARTQLRTKSTGAGEFDQYARMLEHRTQSEAHKSTTNSWRLATLAVALPAVVGTYFFAYSNEHADVEREKVEGRPPFIPYPHLRIWSKKRPLPWGDGEKTLFHNPKKNALKNGYEDEANE